MAAVDSISAIDVRDNGVSNLFGTRFLVPIDLLKVCLLVRASMCSQHGLLIDIVGIRAATTRMVQRKAEDIEVLRSRNNGTLLVVVSVDGTRELTFNELPGDSERVVLVEVESSSDVGEDGIGSVGPLVCGVRFIFNC